MKCKQCDLDTSTGDNYTFYYGVYTSSNFVDSHHILHNYKIAGSETVFICDLCLKKYLSRRMDKITIFLAVLAIASFVGWFLLKDLSESQLSGLDPSGFLSGGMVMLIMIPIGFAIRNRQWKNKGRKTFGDYAAIKLRKPELKSRGYTKFFTREDHNKLF